MLCGTARGRNTIDATMVQWALQMGCGRAASETGQEAQQESGVTIAPYLAAREQFERSYFRDALQRHGGNVSRVAKEAGMHRPNLIRKLKELGISAEEFRRGAAST